MKLRWGTWMVLSWVCGLLQTYQATAQIKITFPVNRMVVQRSNANQATVQIAGSYSQPLDLIEARVVARAANQGTSTTWTTLQTNPINGQFNGNLTVKGGWYQVQVRGWQSGVVVASDSVSRFGVGEVFALLGHSNVQGSACTVNGVNQCPSLDGASDDRVTIVLLETNSSPFQQYMNTADTRYLPGLEFSKLINSTGMGISPFGGMAWFWGHMGDVLVSQLNVPVLIYNAGFGGTSMQQNYWAAYNIPFQHSFVRYDLRMPYANIRNIMNLYVPTTGLRAVLVQHGENERDNPADSTAKYYYKVIDKLRTDYNKPNLGVIVALSSFVGAVYQNPRTAQQRIINTPNYLAYQGPDLDNINTLTDRPDGIHFSPSGQTKAGESWANAINSTYQAITPYMAESQPLASLACATSNQLTVTQPTGYQYNWSTGSANNSLTAGAGTYSARLMTDQNKVYFPPAVVVPSNVQPPAPTITTDNGILAICQSAGLTLRSSYVGPNRWSTGPTSTSILVNTPGSYSVQAQNPVYGCLSAAGTQTISRASADLNLTTQTSRRVVALNDTVSFWFTVQNKGGCDAGSLSFQTRLPPNLSFISSGDNLSASNNIVSGSLNGVAAGTTLSRRYVSRVTAEGVYITSAELTATTSPMLAATLNNGTANGEKDEAKVDFRTKGASSIVYQSPNPNQVALPSVQANQPTPDPNKVDLSLLMQSSSRVINVNVPVSMTLTVKNEGGITATNVAISGLLPAGIQFVSSPSGITASSTTRDGSVINGSISQIPAGSSAKLILVVQATRVGLFTNQVQIVNCSQTDTDSTPNNGYTNGEDDQASLSLRVGQ